MWEGCDVIFISYKIYIYFNGSQKHLFFLPNYKILNLLTFLALKCLHVGRCSRGFFFNKHSVNDCLKARRWQKVKNHLKIDCNCIYLSATDLTKERVTQYICLLTKVQAFISFLVQFEILFGI